jgi:hypothetical protein
MKKFLFNHGQNLIAIHSLESFDCKEMNDDQKINEGMSTQAKNSLLLKAKIRTCQNWENEGGSL